MEVTVKLREEEVRILQELCRVLNLRPEDALRFALWFLEYMVVKRPPSNAPDAARYAYAKLIGAEYKPIFRMREVRWDSAEEG